MGQTLNRMNITCRCRSNPVLDKYDEHLMICSRTKGHDAAVKEIFRMCNLANITAIMELYKSGLCYYIQIAAIFTRFLHHIVSYEHNRFSVCKQTSTSSLVSLSSDKNDSARNKKKVGQRNDVYNKPTVFMQ
mmetsp:Transcript_28590/g.35069  ORF Transcript_28590/g.35069 Transcript_28590/m.35069 type:complete len:132 (+) Transcript_28590:87-482(+)